MRWRIDLTSRAARQLRKLERSAQAGLLQALGSLVDELSLGIELPNVVANVTKMVGIEPPEWRLRVGDFRARFYVEVREIEPDTDAAPSLGQTEFEGLLVVFKVGNRRDVYRD